MAEREGRVGEGRLQEQTQAQARCSCCSWRRSGGGGGGARTGGCTAGAELPGVLSERGEGGVV